MTRGANEPELLQHGTTNANPRRNAQPTNDGDELRQHRPPRTSPASRASLKIASLNICGRTANADGVRQEKWFEINRLMTEHQLGILAVQETHMTDELERSFRQLFSRSLDLYHSPSPVSTNAAGVAIVINKSTIKTDSLSHHTLIEGRAILTELPWQTDESLRILVVYAPNHPRDNQLFWEQLTEIFECNPKLNPDVILGDLNIVEDGLDRAPGHMDDASAVEALRILKDQVGVADGWRRTNPDWRSFTYTHKANGSQSRIDRIYVAEEMLLQSTEWKIETTSILTDHRMISARISTATSPLIGRGRWAIPLYVLEDENTWKEVCTLAKQLEDDIETAKFRRTDSTNPQTLYQKFKEATRELCRSQARKIIPSAKHKIQKLYENSSGSTTTRYTWNQTK